MELKYGLEEKNSNRSSASSGENQRKVVYNYDFTQPQPQHQTMNKPSLNKKISAIQLVKIDMEQKKKMT